MSIRRVESATPQSKKKVPHFDSCASQAQPITTAVTIDRHRKSDSKAKSSISAVKICVFQLIT